MRLARVLFYRIPDYLVKTGKEYRRSKYPKGSEEDKKENLKWIRHKRVLDDRVIDWKVFNGDIVEILTGKDKGKQGRIVEIIKERSWVFVSGLNCTYRTVKNEDGSIGAYLKEEEPLPVGDIALVDPTDNAPTEVVYRYTEGGERVRISTKTGKIIPIPDMEREEEMRERDNFEETDKDTRADHLVQRTYTPSLMSFKQDILNEHGIQETRQRHKTWWY